jgi:hypothetical protein
MKTSPFTSRPAMNKHGSTDVRAIRRYPHPIKVKGRPAPGYNATTPGNFADWDEGTDQDAQAASFFKMFGMTTPVISGSPPDSQ